MGEVVRVFELPYAPTANTYYRHVVITRGKKRYAQVKISAKGRIYRQRVKAILAAEGVEPSRAKIKLSIRAFMPDKRKRDIDNLLKPILDSLQHGGAYVDDFQVVELSIKKAGHAEGGKILLEMREVEPS